jgi:Spy/CpxP family protein refolding chaperone
LAAALKLSPEQTQRMADAVRRADGRMIPTFQQFGRGFLAGFSASETAETRRREMEAQIPRLRRMVAERDEALRRVLTPEQQSRLKAREGKPLPIEWDPWEFVK